MLWISTAYAMAGSPQAGGEANIFAGLAPFILMFAVFYFLLVRPQQKRAKQHKEMVNSLRRGDEIITNSGVFGRVVDTDEATLMVDIGSGTIIKIMRTGVSAKPAASAHVGEKTSKKADKKGDKKSAKAALEAQPEKSAQVSEEQAASAETAAATPEVEVIVNGAPATDEKSNT